MFAISSTSDGLRITWDKKLLSEYHFQTGGPRTYLHPLRLLDSPDLTMNRPHDHIHHQGMWVAWKKVNGVNFWEQPAEGTDPSGFGRIVHKEVLESSFDSQIAQFTTRNSWIDWQDNSYMDETRQTVVYAPKESHMNMDVKIQFGPGDKDVKLDLKRGEPGKGGLFYSGLTIRFHNDLTLGELLDADGRKETMEIFGSRSRWCGFSGQHKEDGNVYGITILDHPDNPRYPTTWWVRNAPNYGIIQPGLCYYEPYEIRAGDMLELKYRVVLHKGKVNPEFIQNISKDYGS